MDKNCEEERVQGNPPVFSRVDPPVSVNTPMDVKTSEDSSEDEETPNPSTTTTMDNNPSTLTTMDKEEGEVDPTPSDSDDTIPYNPTTPVEQDEKVEEEEVDIMTPTRPVSPFETKVDPSETKVDPSETKVKEPEFYYWACHTDYLRCIVTRQKHCKYSKYDISDRWLVFRNHDFDYTVMVLIGAKLTVEQGKRHGAQYHKAMGKQKKWSSYYIKKVAVCKTRVKLDVSETNNQMPLQVKSLESIRRVKDALSKADVYDIKCNLCEPQEESETAPLICNEEDIDDHGDGCMLFSLNKCVPDVLTSEDLDAQIKPVFQEKNKTSEYKLTMEECGTPNKTWHAECIVRALKAKYGQDGFSWKRQPREVLWQKNQGRFYVTGELNRKLYPDLDQNGNWSHAICVDTDNGKFYDSNHPKEKKMFKPWFQTGPNCFMNIWRVYKLELTPGPKPTTQQTQQTQPEQPKQTNKKRPRVEVSDDEETE